MGDKLRVVGDIGPWFGWHVEKRYVAKVLQHHEPAARMDLESRSAFETASSKPEEESDPGVVLLRNARIFSETAAAMSLSEALLRITDKR